MSDAQAEQLPPQEYLDLQRMQIIENCVTQFQQNSDPEERERAFKALKEEFDSPLSKKVSDIVPYHEVEDVIQDSYIKISANLARMEYRDPQQTYSWMKTLATNTAIDKYRKIKNRAKLHMFMPNEDIDLKINYSQNPTGELEIQDPEWTVVEHSERDRIMEVIETVAETERFTEQWKNILGLMIVGMQQKEIATTLGIPENTVGSSQHRIRDKLRKALGQAATEAA